MRGGLASAHALTAANLHEHNGTNGGRGRADSNASDISKSSRNSGMSFETLKEASRRKQTQNYIQNRPRSASHNGAKRVFIELGDALYKIAYGKRFEKVVLSAIVSASIVLALQTYDRFEQSKMLDGIDVVVFFIFVLEFVLKLLAESVKPWMYFIGPNWQWNCFDFSVIALTVLPLGNNYTALRMVRLMRLTKLIKHAPRLRVLLAGLWGGMSQIMYISLLIMLLQYLYAIVGIVLFGDNDPDHFGSLFAAMVTLLRVATLEDWTDVLYINYYGCDNYTNDDRYEFFSRNASLVPTPIVASHKVMCDKPMAQPVTAVMYFFSFTMIASLVMLSMFVGAITISMAERVQDIQRLEARYKKMKRQNTAFMRNTEKKRDLTIDEKNDQNRASHLLQDIFLGHSGGEFVPLLHEHFYGRIWKKTSVICRKIAHSMNFKWFVIFVIVCVGGMAGLSVDKGFRDDESFQNANRIFGQVAFAIFVFELFVNVGSYGFRPIDFWFYHGHFNQPYWQRRLSPKNIQGDIYL